MDPSKINFLQSVLNYSIANTDTTDAAKKPSDEATANNRVREMSPEVK